MSKNYQTINYNSKIKLYLNSNFDLLNREDINEIVDEVLKQDKGELIWERRNRKTFLFSKAGENFYLKKYDVLNADEIYDKLRNISFISGDAVKEFVNLTLLDNNSVAVIKPVLAIEERLAPFFKNSILLTKEFKGFKVVDIIRDEDYSYHLKSSLVKKAAKELFKLHKFNLIHGDYRFRNLLVKFDSSEIEKVVFLDLDRVKKVRFFKKYHYIKDWAKFISDWINWILKFKLSENKKFDFMRNEFIFYKNLICNRLKLNYLQNKFLKLEFNNRLHIDVTKLEKSKGD